MTSARARSGNVSASVTTAATSASISNSQPPCANVQQLVIALVLADHEILWSVVEAVAIHVVNDGAFWQWMPERTLRNHDVLVLIPDSSVREVANGDLHALVATCR